MDGAANMSGQNKGWTVLFEEKAPIAVYNYCANHDLNLVLGKCSKVPEIRWSNLEYFSNIHQSDAAYLEIVLSNITQPSRKTKKLPKRSLKCFVKSDGWKKNILLENFQKMYEPILQSLESITSTDDWDGNSVIQALIILKSIANSTFIAVFNTTK